MAKYINPPNQSKGILDDFAIRKNVATREGTIEKVPVNDSDIANKKYIDDEITTYTSDLRDDSMADTLHRHSELSASDGSPNPALSVDASGNVGIGTTSPTFNFQIKGTSAAIAEIESSSSDATVLLLNNTNSGQRWGIGVAGTNNLGGVSTDASFYIRDETANSVKFVIENNTGNVGIGTTSPEAKLHIGSADTSSSMIKFGTGNMAMYLSDANNLYLTATTSGVANFYVEGNVSAASFTDRTPYPKDLETAYEAVLSMERLPDGEYNENNKEQQLDHSKLNDFIKSGNGRDLSATVSSQNEVIKDLIKKVEDKNTEIEAIKQENLEIKKILCEELGRMC